MKALTIFFALIAIAFISCTNNSHSDNLIGTFANQSKSDYSVALDTLTITPLDQSENSYQVERRTGFQKIRSGIIQPKEYKVEKWLSTWNSEKQVLSETEYGRQITLSKDGHTLSLKNIHYRRIK